MKGLEEKAQTGKEVASIIKERFIKHESSSVNTHPQLALLLG
jgi:hypothetical protein